MVKDFTKTFPSCKQFMGRRNCGMLAEYCWSIVTETPESGYKIKIPRKTF
jgi:hypothetical protein